MTHDFETKMVFKTIRSELHNQKYKKLCVVITLIFVIVGLKQSSNLIL